MKKLFQYFAPLWICHVSFCLLFIW